MKSRELLKEMMGIRIFVGGLCFFGVEEGSAGDRIGEHKVQTIPGRKGSSV